MSSTSDLYETNMSLFDHGDPEEFFIFYTQLQYDTCDHMETGDGREDSVSLYAILWGSAASV